MNVDTEQHVVVTENYSALLSVSVLTKDDVEDVLQGRCLSDNVMCTVSSLLNEYVQAIHNDQLECEESAGALILHILHCSTKQHWITVSNIGCN